MAPSSFVMILGCVAAVGCGGAAATHADGASDAPANHPDAGTDAPVDASGETATCACGAHGSWMIDNKSPCFFSDAQQNVTGATSTVMSSNFVSCPADDTAAPTAAWSTDTFTIDCPGQYHLCLTMKAGDPKSPQASDCVMAQSCADGTATVVGQPQQWAPLPSWIATGDEVACAKLFSAMGGYAELTLSGTPEGCGPLATRSIGQVIYCPTACAANPAAPGCAPCVSGGSGTF